MENSDIQLEAQAKSQQDDVVAEEGKQQSRKRGNRRNKSKKPQEASATMDDQQQQQEEQNQNGESKKEKRNRNQQNRPQREFKNVFGDAILEPEQIRDTCIDSAQNTYLEPNALLEKLRQRNGFSKLIRVHERQCEFNQSFGVIDYSLKANSRSCRDNDHAYFSARHDLTVWNNVHDGNSLLIEYSEAEENQVENVTFLR